MLPMFDSTSGVPLVSREMIAFIFKKKKNLFNVPLWEDDTFFHYNFQQKDVRYSLLNLKGKKQLPKFAFPYILSVSELFVPSTWSVNFLSLPLLRMVGRGIPPRLIKG